MSKKWMAAIIAAAIFVLSGIGTVIAGYLDCNKCGCNGFYSYTSGLTCNKCGHSFSDHRR